MISNRLAFGALALACVAAAAGGGYLATRQANLSTEAAAPSGGNADPSVSGSAFQSVQDTAVTAPSGPSASAPVVPEPPAEPHVETGLEPTRRTVNRVRPEPVRTPTTGARATAPVPASEPRVAERTAEASGERVPEGAAAAIETPAAPAQADNRIAVSEPAAAAESLPSTPVAPITFEELVVSADSVIGLELDNGVTSERARVEDDVEARVVRDVRVGRRVAIPAGSRALGSVVLVERGGKFKERARLGIRFHTLVVADGSRLPIQTDTIYRYGSERGDSSAKKIGGGAVAGAILGAIIGGAKGAAVGATAGAGGGTAMVMAGERSPAEFQSGAEVTARILSPVTVTIER